MKYCNWSIDWLTCTRKFEGRPVPVNHSDAQALATSILREIGIPADTYINNITKTRWYRYVFQLQKYRTKVSISDSLGQGVRIELPGRCLSELAYDGISGYDTMKGWHKTRIDVALDLHGYGINIENIFNRLHTKDKYKTMKFIQSQTGQTLNIGSRTSEKYIRIYDKGSQLGNPEQDWIRIEIEMKHDLAGSFDDKDEEYVVNYASDVLKELVSDYSGDLASQIDWYDENIAIDHYIERTHESDKLKWFRTIVMSALRTLREDDYETYLKASNELLAEMCNTSVDKVSTNDTIEKDLE